MNYESTKRRIIFDCVGELDSILRVLSTIRVRLPDEEWEYSHTKVKKNMYNLEIQRLVKCQKRIIVAHTSCHGSICIGVVGANCKKCSRILAYDCEWEVLCSHGERCVYQRIFRFLE